MTESEIQKILFANFMEKRRRRIYRISAPNIYMYDWESDYLGITSYDYAHEYEIKLSKEDYLADFNKKDKHNLLRSFYNSPSPYHNIPKRFYYVIHGFWLQVGELPDYAGLLVITNDRQIKRVRVAPDLPAKKINNDQLFKLATSLSHRFWRNYENCS